MAWNLSRVAPFPVIVAGLSLWGRIPWRRRKDSTGRVLHLPSMFAVFPKPLIVIPIPGPFKLDVLLKTAAIRRNRVVTVTKADSKCCYP